MRVEQLAEHFGDQIEIEWKSFLLRTEPKARSLEKFVEYTHSWQRPASTEPLTNYTTPWASGDEPPTSSLPAQVAWKVAKLFGADAQDRYHQALLVAYFTDNRTISDPEVLGDIAEECDLNRDEFAAALAEHGNRLAQEVIDEHNAAIQREIGAVPTVLIGDVFPIPGAQELDTYVRYIERYIEKREEIEAIKAENKG